MCLPILQRFARSIELPYVFYPLDQIENMSAHLDQIRTEIGQQMLPLGAPLFDMRLTERGDGRWTIHFGIDFMIADALSLFIFWQDFSEIYKGVLLPPIEPR